MNKDNDIKIDIKMPHKGYGKGYKTFRFVINGMSACKAAFNGREIEYNEYNGSTEIVVKAEEGILTAAGRE